MNLLCHIICILVIVGFTIILVYPLDLEGVDENTKSYMFHKKPLLTRKTPNMSPPLDTKNKITIEEVEMDLKKSEKYYKKANNKNEGTIMQEGFFKEVLEYLEKKKNFMFANKFHKDSMANMQKAIDLIALDRYHVEVINARDHQEDLDCQEEKESNVGKCDVCVQKNFKLWMNEKILLL